MSDASRSKAPASPPSQPVVPTLVPATTVSLSAADRRSQSLLMRACRREPVERTPVWLMRQAGRYLPEYRRVREQVDFMGLVKNPRLAAEVMIATVERLGVDAAIIFSDLLPILEPMGMNLEFTAGEGPVIHNPLREPADVQRLRELDDLDPLGYVMDVVRATRAGLDDSLPVIGFAGARVIEQTVREKLPEGFQRAEYLLEHGILDMVVKRGDMRETLARVISLLRQPLLERSDEEAEAAAAPAE